MAIVFIFLSTIGGVSTIGFLIFAATLNQVWPILAAIGAGLLTWLFIYMVNNTEL